MTNPYFAMKTSYELGFKENAYAYAKDYLDRADASNVTYDGKFVNVLIYSMELGDKFLSKENAERLRDEVRLYCSVEDIAKRNKMLDEYYRNTPPSMQVAVYSYENYVSTIHSRACAILGERSFICGGELLSSNGVIDVIGTSDLSQKEQLFNFAVILNQITEYEQVGSEISLVSDMVASRFEQFVSAAVGYEDDDLFRLFLVRSALALSQQKIEDDEVWLQSVQGYSLSDYYYKVLLYNYVQN